MRLKNYNADLVLDTVRVVLKDRPEVRATRSFVLDVAAYVLNRIPPKYIMSERGFTREFAGAVGNGDGEGERLTNVIELITLVNRGIEVVGKRRHDGSPGRRSGAVPRRSPLTYFYNMPHIFGRIVDARDGAPVISAKATLWINDKVAAPAESGWRNPYLTNEHTRGYFSFWPKVATGEADSERFQVKIGFSHDRYEPLTYHKNVKVPGEFFVYDYIRGDKLLDVGTLAMQPAR